MATSKLKEWADAVKARDGKCVECGRVEDLHAHHIKPKSSHPELSLDLTNGRTLCYRCHKVAHEKSRSPRSRSTRPQRRTLERQIERLRDEVQTLKQMNKVLNQTLAEYERKTGIWKTGVGSVAFAKPTPEEAAIARQEMVEWRARHAATKQGVN